MGVLQSFQCSYCGQHTTITGENSYEKRVTFDKENVHGLVAFDVWFLICTNKQCRKVTSNCALFEAEYRTSQTGRTNLYITNEIERWKLLPKGLINPLPGVVPEPIREDFEEAELIRENSPKASATLARRAIQGMIRDFFGISKGRLVDEIDAIKDKVEGKTWDAIDAVRQIGNIGAHMEKDINTIVEVDEDEAKILLELIRMLADDWYVARHDRQVRLDKITGIAKEKKEAKKGKPK